MQVEPSFPLGTSGQELFAKKHGLVRGREEYERFWDVPFYGTYFLSKPRLVVKEGIVLGRLKLVRIFYVIHRLFLSKFMESSLSVKLNLRSILLAYQRL